MRVALCSTLHTHKPATGDVTCSVQKSWRKEVLTKIMARGKLTWPWGDARCTTDLKFDRATLIKAMTEPEFEAQFDTHDSAASWRARRRNTRSSCRSIPKSPSSKERP